MNNNVSPFYALVGVGLGMIVAILANGCASPARAESETESPSTAVIIEESSEMMIVREDSRLVVRMELTDEVAPDALSAPIVGLEESDALIDAGLRIGDEVLLVSDGFDSLTVDSYGNLEEAFTRISAAVDDNDSYLDVLVRRDGRNLMITVAAMPTT